MLGKEFSRNEISQILNIGKAFIFLDSAIITSPGKEIKAIYAFHFEDPIVEAHFIGNPVIPGSLILESAFQAMALLIYESRQHLNSNTFITGVEANFYATVKPADELHITARILNYSRGIIKGQISIFVEEALKCSANVNYFSPGFVENLGRKVLN